MCGQAEHSQASEASQIVKRATATKVTKWRPNGLPPFLFVKKEV